MLRHRLITGPLLILGLLALVWFDEVIGRSGPRGLLFAVVGVAAVVLMAGELHRIAQRSGIASCRTLVTVAALAGFLTLALPADLVPQERRLAVGASVAIAILCAGLFRYSRGETVQGVFAATGALLFVTVYGGVLLAFWILIRSQHSAWIVLGAILTVKSCDIGAYFTGMSLGRHKLIPWLSPKKTWEGLLGGVATSAIVGSLFALASGFLPEPVDHLPWWLGALIGVAVGVVGQLGDLSESLLKRGADLKDSGALLPGMGGILDVLDSLLLAGPVVFWLLALASR